MEALPKKSRHFMPKALLVKPSGPQPQDPYTQLILPLIVILPFNCFCIQLLGQVIFCVWPNSFAPHS